MNNSTSYTFSAQGGRYVDVVNSSSQNGTRLQIWNAKPDYDGQKFVYADGNIRYKDKCFSVPDDMSNGVPVSLQPCNGSKNQQWLLRSTGLIRNGHSDKCLNIPGNVSSNGEKLNMWDCSINNLGQIWTPQEVSSEVPNIAAVVTPSVCQMPSTNPTILNNLYQAPQNIPQTVSDLRIPFSSVVLVTPSGSSVILPLGITSFNDQHRTCLRNQSISTLAIGARTKAIVTLNSGVSHTFINKTFEHQFNYEVNLNSRMDEGDKIASIMVEQVSLQPTVKSIIPSNDTIVTGQMRIRTTGSSAYSDYSNFQLSPNQDYDILLGPMTVLILDPEIVFYNSQTNPLAYYNVHGLSKPTKSGIYQAAPLNSGYATLTEQCDYTGISSKLIVGDYKLDTASTQGLIIGPYTKVTFYEADNADGISKVFENNSSIISKYNMCSTSKVPNTINSIRIEFSDTYLGFGIFAPASIPDYQLQPLDKFCNSLEAGLPQMTDNDNIGELLNLQPVNNQPICDADRQNMVDTFVTKKSQTTTNGYVNDFSSLNMNCGNYAIDAFNILESDNGYFRNYTCNSTNDMVIQSKRTEKFIPSSLNNMAPILIDCEGKPLTSVTAVNENNSMYFEYTCGNTPLTNIRSYDSEATTGTGIELSSLAYQSVMCPSGSHLTSFNLNNGVNTVIDKNRTYRYSYKFTCGSVPIKESFGSLIKSPTLINISYFVNGIEHHQTIQTGSTMPIFIDSDDFILTGNADVKLINDNNMKNIKVRGSVRVYNDDYTDIIVTDSNDFDVNVNNEIDWFNLILIMIVIIFLIVILGKIDL